MNDPSYALQLAFVSALLADASVTDLLANPDTGPAVYDALTRADDVYPRAEIRHIQAVPSAKSTRASTPVWLTLDLWSSGADGRLVNERISNAMGASIDGVRPAPAGYRIVTSYFEGAQHLDDPDGLTAHSVLTWRFGMTPAPAS